MDACSLATPAFPSRWQSEIKKAYEFGNDLGSGNFAVVKKAKYKNYTPNGPIPAEVAIKIIDKAKVEDMNDIQREVEIMQMVDHTHVIKLYEIFDEPKKMHLVMELVTGGELFDRIVAKGNYNERPAEDAPIKIADFGLARLVSSKDLMKTACGTPGYVAPEVLRNQGYDSGAVDMWSAGVILYIMLCGFPPFYEEELPALFDQIMNARYDFPSPWWDDVSKNAKDLVRKLLEINPKKRLTAAQALQEPWIVGQGTDVKLDKSQAALRKYNANRKLRKVALGVIAQNRFAKAVEALSAGASK
ncbi:hypothetical protein AB1Y20_006293 [Prymnesium parvum]|uniref:Protein kinase domain-containing protein n=1 Tax=Prymnesium parvum TaxID=97485 RepID=A0AB34J465_PRYPA